MGLINEFSKVAGYQVNTHESAAFLYRDNEQSEKELIKATSLAIVSKRIKYLGIHQPRRGRTYTAKTAKH